MAIMDGANRGFLHRRGHRRIANSLRQIDAPHAVALDRHGANLGLQSAGRELAQSKARRSDNGFRHRMFLLDLSYRDGFCDTTQVIPSQQVDDPQSGKQTTVAASK
jgi:hypothetical protein